MAHLTGRQRTQRTRRPTTSPHGHTPLPRPTPPPPGPLTPDTPYTHGPTRGLTPQASATSGTEDLPATTHGGPVPQRHHAPPTGPPARPAEPSSPGRPAPGPGPNPDPPRTAAPADAPQPADPGSLPEPPPVAGGHARGAPPPADDGAEPPTPPTQLQRDAPAVGAEGLQRPPHRTPTPAPMGEPGGGTDQTSVQSADLTNEMPHGGDEALADGQPDAEPEGPAPDTGCADGPHRPLTADHAGAAPRAHLAARADTSTPGGGAATRSTGNQREVRGPGDHTRHAPAGGRRGNVTQRGQPRRQLLRCLPGLLQG